MKQKRILSWVIVFVMILTIAIPTKKVYAASAEDVLGGQESVGCLKVKVNDGEILVRKYNGSKFEKQYYKPTGDILDIDGTHFALGDYYYEESGSNINAKATFVSQISDDKSVTTIWNADGIEITQRITLPSVTAQYIKIDWSFENTSNSTINNIHFLRGGDTYLSGGDNGAGFWDASTNTIGVTKEIEGVTQRLGMKGNTVPNSYISADCDKVYYEVIDGGTLSNYVDSNLETDNAYALEWNISSLNPNSIWEVKASESFLASSIIASNDNQVSTGDPVVLAFDVTNSGVSSENVQYSVTSPEGWTAIPQKQNDVISAGSSSRLNVLVTPKIGATSGEYDIVLNILTNDSDTQAIGTVTIKEQQTITTPSAVRITGTQKVGDTLSAGLITENESKFTTSAAVTYKWYRLNNSDSEFVNEIGRDETYKLTNNDFGKYIGVTAIYDEKSFDAITSKITKNSSSSSSSSSKKKQTTTTNNNSTTSLDGWKENTKDWKYIKNGQPVTGWNQIDGSWYFMDSIGIMQTGWKQSNGTWYLLKNNGVMEIGWQQTNNNWYFLKESGAMTTGWIQSNGSWYLLKNNGAMATGWQQSNGEWYYLYSDGAMAKNTVIDGYQLNENGAWIN